MARRKIPQEFGILLKDLRSEAQLTQEALADAAGFDRTYISLLERGERQPTLSTLFRLAECLHTKPSDILRRLEE